MAIRVQKNPEDFGRCGCGRREYCDGSHSLSEAEWQARLARERATQATSADATDRDTTPRAGEEGDSA